MRVLLSSTGIKTEKYARTFLSISEGLKKDVAIITTASEKFKEKNKNVVALKNRLSSLGFSGNYVDVELEGLYQLEQADIIFLAGGNPYYLLHHLRQSGADELILEKVNSGKLVVGISAGIFTLMERISIVDSLTPQLNTVGVVDKKGLGVIQEVIVPHFDRFIEQGIIDEDKIVAFEIANKCKVIRLKEAEVMEYTEKGYRII